MKKLFLSLAVTSALGLTGCFASGDDANVSEEEYSVPYARVAFDPGNGVVPIPSDILLSGTTDGTLNLPVADPSDFSDPQTALTALDGWSALMPSNFEFTLPYNEETGGRINVNSSSVTASGSVRVFKTVMGGDTRYSECATAPAGSACMVLEELEHGSDFAVAYNNGEVTVQPLRPYEGKMGYIITLTDGITDELGRSVRPSSTYYLLSKPLDTDPIGGAQEQALQGVINSHLNALANFGVNPDSVIYSSGFTVQSMDDVLQVVKQMMLQEQLRPQMQAAPTGMTAADLLVAAGQMQPDPTNPAFLVSSSAHIYGGQVTLPYFSGVPTEENPAAPLTERWEAGFVSVASIVTGLQSGAVTVEELVGLGVDPAQLENPASLAGQITYEAAADTALVELDRFRHLTKFNPIPRVRTINEVPLWMSVPDLATVNALRAQQGMEPLEMPENGWPVVMFQHGITGTKENFLPLAGMMALFGHAVVSIDHPLHGDRGYELPDGTVFNASSGAGGSPTDYLNLGNLLAGRDNLRQSVSDLLGVRLGLNFAQIVGADINPADVKFVGHSLGGITGANFIAVANSPLPEEMAMAEAFYSVQSGVFGMAGGGIGPFLVASESFGPLIGAQVAFSAMDGFQQYAVQEAMSSGIEPGSPEFMDFLPMAYYQYFEGGIASSQEQAVLQATLGQFQFAAQTVVDSADPINYGALLQHTDTPVLLLQVDGDAVVPNTTPHPLAGTEPLARVMGLPNVSATTQSQDGAPLSGFLRFDGNHSSLLDPSADAAVTQDMQQMIGLYFETGARLIMTETAK